MAVTTSVSVKSAAQQTVTGALSSATAVYSLTGGVSWKPGTGTGKCDLTWTGEITLAASATQDIDLSGSLEDTVGNPVVFAKVKGITVVAAVGNTNNVVVGGAPSNAFVGPFGAAAHTIAVSPNSPFCVAHAGDGWTVTAGTGDLLRVANSGAGSTVTFSIKIDGASA